MSFPIYYYNFSLGRRLKMTIGGSRFLLTEAVTRNRLAKSINRSGHYNAPTSKNNLFMEADAL
jgi:hypothetical protein